MKNPTPLITLISFLLFSSCATHQMEKITGPSYDESFQVNYVKNEEMKNAGPEFHVSLKGNKFEFIGFANNEYEDKEMGSISKKEYDKYRSAFNGSNFSNFNNSYLKTGENLPVSSITYKGHKVRFHKSAAPASLNELAVLMEEFVFGDRRKIYGL